MANSLVSPPLSVAQMRQKLRVQQLIRQFLTANSYDEWQTPIVVPMPGTEANLQYFASPWRDVAGRPKARYLRSSPELHLKKVLAHTGAERIFELGRCFRNGGELGPWHHPEFTMLEWYRVRASADSMMEETLALIAELHGQLGSEVAFCPDEVPVFAVAEAFADFAGLELLDGDPALAAKARERGIQSVRPNDDFETAFFKILIEKVEPSLAAWPAVWLCDYPPSQAALATVEDGVAKRFELYMSGVEISNGFFELTSAAANRQRIAEATSLRQRAGLAVPPVDEDFLAALAHGDGLPPCSGTALGVDRLHAVLMGYDSLDQVVGFRRSFGLAPGADSNG